MVERCWHLYCIETMVCCMAQMARPTRYCLVYARRLVKTVILICALAIPCADCDLQTAEAVL